MAPARKKSKPNIDAPRPPPESPQTPRQGDPAPLKLSPTDSPETTTPGVPSPRPSSWYSGGSWRAKASPVAQIARESILVAKGATSEASEESSRRPSQSVSKSVRGSRKSIPLAAEATRVHVTSDTGDKSRPRFPLEEKSKAVEKGKGVDAVEELSGLKNIHEAKGAVGTSDRKDRLGVHAALVEEPAPLPPEPPAMTLDVCKDSESLKGTDVRTARPQSGAWFGWWSRPDGYGSDGEVAQEGPEGRVEAEEASHTPLPGTPVVEPVVKQPIEPEPANGKKSKAATKDQAKSTAVDEGTAKSMPVQQESLQREMSTNNASSRSWFSLWSSTQNEQAASEAQSSKAQPEEQTPVPEISVSAEPSAVEHVAKQRTDGVRKEEKKDLNGQPKSSGWAFWSTDRPNDSQPASDGTQTEVGQLAVADTPSQSHPEAAQFNEQRDQPQQLKQEVKRTGSLLMPKRGRTEEVKGSNASGVSTPASASSRSQTPAVSQIPTPTETPPRDSSEAPAPIKRGKAAQTRPNLILPSFRDTYPEAPNPGYVERLSNYLAQTLRIAPATSQLNHVYHISPSPVKIKRAIAIGIHGFFPAPLIQKVLGQPTGTSIRFANYAAATVKSWCQENQPDVKDIEVEKVALEGEGTISDRVAMLWKLLLNWLSHLRNADFILIACHSQGVPVAFVLVAKLIQLGCLSPHVRIGVCAMAGINLGPFLEYKSRLFGGSALELFDFCDADSKVSKQYAEALDVCLRHGVRATLIGSLDDQLVSLESSLYAPLSHPYVSRAVFIDGRLHAPNFLTHLVVFALKLRNRGISDHGLLRELSAPLAGSLVGGEGHSRVYDDAAVYRLAIDFALESTDIAPTTPAPAPPTATASLLAQDKEKQRAAHAARRASLSGYPPTMASANGIRRGSVTSSSQLPGLAPLIAHYKPPQGAANTNPFYLPWAVRGMLGEEAVRGDEGLWAEVQELVREFEEWRPTSKVLRDVRWRLEGVRSMI